MSRNRGGLHEVVVVGGGPAGVNTALRARKLGTGVAMVESGELGCTCTNDGCVPTRVLAHAARLVRDAEQFAQRAAQGRVVGAQERLTATRCRRALCRAGSSCGPPCWGG